MLPSKQPTQAQNGTTKRIESIVGRVRIFLIIFKVSSHNVTGPKIQKWFNSDVSDFPNGR